MTATWLQQMDRLFQPRSIAVVGASANPTRLGGRLLSYLLAGGFPGDVYAISPSGDELQGVPGAKKVSELPTAPDLALVCVPSSAVAGVVSDAGVAGTGAAVVLSSGFAELGAEGLDAQKEIRDVAASTGMRVLGPNSVGLVNLNHAMVASFMRFDTQNSELRPIAVVSQSGAFGGGLFNDAQRRGLGAALYCATGNEGDLEAAEVVEYVIEQDKIKVVLLSIEGVRDPRRLARVAARAAALGKSIVILKMGSSEPGARGAQGHTGAIASDDDVLRAALGSEGVIFATTSKGIVDQAALCLADRRPQGKRLAIVTAAGGMGVHLADIASRLGFQVPVLPPDEQAKLRECLPHFASPINPIDMTAQSINDPAILPNVLHRALNSDSYDGLVFYGTNSTWQDSIVTTLSECHQRTKMPLVVVAHDDAVARDLSMRGVPAVADPSRALEALSALVRASAPTPADRRRRPSGRRGVIPHEGLLRQADAFTLLKAFGLSVADFGTAASIDTAVEVATDLGFPVAMKLDSVELVHKSDHGAVMLNLADADAVSRAADRLTAVASSLGIPADLLVQKMISADIELFCGMRRDADFGPVMVVGLGGRLVEVIGQTEMLMATEPDDHILAALNRLACGRLTSHSRGISSAIPSVVKAVGAVAQLALDHEEITEVEINPLAVCGTRVVAVDVVCRADRGLGPL